MSGRPARTEVVTPHTNGRHRCLESTFRPPTTPSTMRNGTAVNTAGLPQTERWCQLADLLETVSGDTASRPAGLASALLNDYTSCMHTGSPSGTCSFATEVDVDEHHAFTEDTVRVSSRARISRRRLQHGAAHGRSSATGHECRSTVNWVEMEQHRFSVRSFSFPS